MDAPSLDRVGDWLSLSETSTSQIFFQFRPWNEKKGIYLNCAVTKFVFVRPQVTLPAYTLPLAHRYNRDSGMVFFGTKYIEVHLKPSIMDISGFLIFTTSFQALNLITGFHAMFDSEESDFDKHSSHFHGVIIFKLQIGRPISWSEPASPSVGIGFPLFPTIGTLWPGMHCFCCTGLLFVHLTSFPVCLNQFFKAVCRHRVASSVRVWAAWLFAIVNVAELHYNESLGRANSSVRMGVRYTVDSG